MVQRCDLKLQTPEKTGIGTQNGAGRVVALQPSLTQLLASVHAASSVDLETTKTMSASINLPRFDKLPREEPLLACVIYCSSVRG
jgi:hypothetical protein